MPKLFQVLIDIEEAAVGHVLSTLKRTSGVVEFTLLMDTKKPDKATNGHANGDAKEKRSRYAGDDTAEQLILKSLAKKAPIKSTAFPDIFVKAGRAPTSPTYALHAAKKAGLVQIGKDGYTLTKKGRDKARYV